MSSRKEYYDKIEDYLKGKLSDSEKKEFEALLEDQELREELKFRAAVKQVTTHEGRKELNELFRKWENAQIKRKPGLRRWLTYAAAACILIFILFIWLIKPENDQLYALYFKPYPNVVAPIEKSGEEQLTEYEKAFQFYESGNYSQATELLKALSQDDEDVRFYLAISEMAAGEFEHAAIILHPFAETQNGQYKKAAQWYLALFYVKAGNEERAREYLNLILADPEHPFRSQADDLLSRL